MSPPQRENQNVELPERDFFDIRNQPCDVCGDEATTITKWCDGVSVGGPRCAAHWDTPL